MNAVTHHVALIRKPFQFNIPHPAPVPLGIVTQSLIYYCAQWVTSRDIRKTSVFTGSVIVTLKSSVQKFGENKIIRLGCMCHAATLHKFADTVLSVYLILV